MAELTTPTLAEVTQRTEVVVVWTEAVLEAKVAVATSVARTVAEVACLVEVAVALLRLPMPKVFRVRKTEPDRAQVFSVKG